MIVETIIDLLKLQAPIAGIAGDRIYPFEMPDGTEFPAVVVSKPSGVGEYDLDGDVGLESALVQVDSYAVNYALAVDLATMIRRYLSGKGFAAVSGSPCAIQGTFCINDSDMSDSAYERAGPRLRRRMLVFRVWNTEI